MENVWLAAIALGSSLITAVVAPALMAVIVNRNSRRDKAEDYARQDIVAARAAETAKLLLASNKELSGKTTMVADQAAKAAGLLAKRQDDAAGKAAEAAELLLAANERVAASSAVTNNKLDTIHTLVNSNMTAAMQSELEATTLAATVMQELIDVKEVMGYAPTVEALAALKTATDRIKELKAILKDRLEVTKNM